MTGWPALTFFLVTCICLLHSIPKDPAGSELKYGVILFQLSQTLPGHFTAPLLVNSVSSDFYQYLTQDPSWVYPKLPTHVSETGVWTNWASTLRIKPAKIYSDTNGSDKSLNSLSDIQDAVKESISENRLPVKVFGSSHSFSGLVQTSGTMIDGRKFGWKKGSPTDCDIFDQQTVENWMEDGNMFVTRSDPLANGQPTVTFPPGIATGTLERFIYYNARDVNGKEVGESFSLATSTYEDVFTMGGIVSASCHGTGRNYPTVSDLLVSITFVDGEGIIRKVQADGSCLFKIHENDEWQTWDINQSGLSGIELFKAAQSNYGLFGVMFSMTMRIIPGFNTLFIAENIPWKSYLDNTEESRKNLNDLQNRSNSLEFFYYPFANDGSLLGWEPNPNVYMLRHVTDTPENREQLRQEGFDIVTQPESYFIQRDSVTRRWTEIYSKVKTVLLDECNGGRFEWIARRILPILLSHMSEHLEYTVVPSKNKREAISIPHWRASHSVNAVGAVEKIPVLNIEWTVPMKFNDPSGEGLKPSLDVFAHLVKSIHQASEQLEFPVTVVAEIRFIRGSGSYLSPFYSPNFTFPDDPFENTEGPYEGWSAPEIVSGVHNPWWLSFYERMNTEIYRDIIKDQLPVRNHMAKQFGMIPNQFERLRHEFDREPTKPFTTFSRIRNFVDPNNVFLTPFFDQFLNTNAPHYNPPQDYQISEKGVL